MTRLFRYRSCYVGVIISNNPVRSKNTKEQLQNHPSYTSIQAAQNLQITLETKKIIKPTIHRLYGGQIKIKIG